MSLKQFCIYVQTHDNWTHKHHLSGWDTFKLACDGRPG